MGPRITIRLDQMGGAPCVRGLRIPVSVVLDALASMAPEEVLALHPDLEREDIPAVLQYAAAVVRGERKACTFAAASPLTATSARSTRKSAGGADGRGRTAD